MLLPSCACLHSLHPTHLTFKILFTLVATSEITMILGQFPLYIFYCWISIVTVAFLSSQLNTHILTLQTPCFLSSQKMEMDYSWFIFS